MADEKLTPERAVRLLHAKAGELEAIVMAGHGYHPDRPMRETDELRADIALIATLLADHIERPGHVGSEYIQPLATQQRLNPDGYLSSILEVTEFEVGSKEEADYVAALKAECDAYLGQRRQYPHSPTNTKEIP